MLTSKLSSKGQVTIPKQVRDTLGLTTGDQVGYEIDEAGVRIVRLEPFDAAFHAAASETLQEWASPADEEAFGDL